MSHPVGPGALALFALMAAGCALLEQQESGPVSLPVPVSPAASAPALAGVLTAADEMAPDVSPETSSGTSSDTSSDASPEAIQPEAAQAGPSGIWARMRAGFSLDHHVDRQRVRSELGWFVRNPEYVDRVAKRAEPYLHHVVGELEKRGMPLELALLPVVESAYDPFAYSHGRAAGLWQFIPSTARLYGLKIDWWYDGRRDIRASTRAALDYLAYLHGMFDGDWLLALAAYNAGQGNVMSSIRASERKGGDRDFWSLNVLRETYTYVPRLLAISELVNHPEKHGITLPGVRDEAQWASVDIGGQLDLERAAQLAGMASSDLYKLNPGFNQWATHPDGPHELLVPLAREAEFREALRQLPPGDRVAWTRHKIRRGETLGHIARRYRTTVSAIKAANHLAGNVIRAGDHVLVPAPDKSANYSMTSESRLDRRQQRLRDSLDPDPVKYVVRPGDSLWEISRRYRVGMRELARWNGMGTTGVLRPGVELLIFDKQARNKNAAAPVKTAAISAPARKERVRKLNYRVRAGESLSLIASKFNVTVGKIRQWNQVLAGRKYIHPGDRLTLYVDVTSLIN